MKCRFSESKNKNRLQWKKNSKNGMEHYITVIYVYSSLYTIWPQGISLVVQMLKYAAMEKNSKIFPVKVNLIICVMEYAKKM